MIGYVVEHNFLQFHEAKLSYFLPYTHLSSDTIHMSVSCIILAPG